MNVVRRIVDSSLAPSRGIAFFVVCISIAGGLYLAGLTDGRPNPASANAIDGPPIIKADLTDMIPSGVAHLDPNALRPVVSAAIPSDTPTLVRRLQGALARAGCYDGPISGAWSEPSKAAAGHFVVAANAQLPVGEPDPALLALVESNTNASCGGRGLARDVVEAPRPMPVMIAENRPRDDVIPPSPKEQASADASAAPAKAEGATVQDVSMISRPWAPSEMLTMPRDAPPADMGSQNIIVGSSTPDHSEVVTPSPVTAPAASAAPATATDDDTPKAAAPAPASAPITTASTTPLAPPVSEQTVTVQPDPTAVPDPRDDKPAKKDKSKTAKATKTAKKKPGKSSAPGSFSDGLYSLQKSVSNLFN